MGSLAARDGKALSLLNRMRLIVVSICFRAAKFSSVTGIVVAAVEGGCSVISVRMLGHMISCLPGGLRSRMIMWYTENIWEDVRRR